MNKYFHALIFFCLLSAVSCGTLANFGEGPISYNPYGLAEGAELIRPKMVYGGIDADWQLMKKSVSGESNTSIANLPVALIDFPFSFVSDTLTLPFVGETTYKEPKDETIMKAHFR